MAGGEITVLLRLLNGRRFSAQLAGSAASVRAFGKEVEAAGAATTTMASAAATGRATLFAIGTASRVASFGMAALATGALDLGFKFDATMESNTLAFTKFTGSATAARAELNQLFEIAAATPFTFADVTTAARRLQAFGFSAQDTVKWIKILGDTISYVGGSADDVLRAVKTVGEIHSLGRLQYRQVLQLTTLGIGAQDILQKRLGITGKQWHNISHANISDTKALGALQEGLIEKYGGGAKAYSKTFIGQINKVKDYSQRAAGQLVKPLFKYLEKDVFPSINKWLAGPDFKRAIPTIRQAFEVLGAVVAAPFVIGYKALKILWKALQPLGPFIKKIVKPFAEGLGQGVGIAVITSFKVLADLLHTVASILGSVSNALGFTGNGFKVLGTIIGVLFAGRILKTLGLLGRFPGLFRLIGVAAKIAAIPVRLFSGMLSTIFTRAMPTATLAARTAGLGLGSRLAAGVGMAMRAFGWAALGAYIAHELGLDHALLDPIVRALKGPWNSVREFFSPGSTWHPGNNAKYKGGMYFDPSQFHKDQYGNWVRNMKRRMPAGRHPIGGAATGGVVGTGGWSWVGENGPELRWLPPDTTIVNHRASMASRGNTARHGGGWGHAMPAPSFDDVNIHFVAPIIIDKKKVGEAVGSYAAEREARR